LKSGQYLLKLRPQKRIVEAFRMYIIAVDKMISAAHQLHDYDGPCARIHGHNWKVRVEVRADASDDSGITLDFNELESWLEKITARFDHQLINSIPPFDKLNPTAENLVKYIYNQMKEQLPPAMTMYRTSIWETENYMVSYEE
jgi:6-pyruvoyltetrahydropterin/6-carboxytetrahydropterin synthase